MIAYKIQHPRLPHQCESDNRQAQPEAGISLILVAGGITGRSQTDRALNELFI